MVLHDRAQLPLFLPEMARGAFDIRALAKAVNRRRQEFNRRNPERQVSITPALSRILENDDEYVPYRSRDRGKRNRPAVNPRITTIVEIAAALDTTVGDLLGEPAFRMTRADRRRLREVVRYLTRLFDLDAPELDDPGRDTTPRGHS